MATRKEKQKQRKEKKKNAEKKRKILANRASIRSEAKTKREEARRDRQIRRIQKSMKNIEYYAPEFLETLPQKTLDQIEKNAEILRAIEDEYEAERQSRAQLNEILEGEGAVTMDDKMNLIAQRAMEQGEENICINEEEKNS